ncbi:MAG: hypothetical protein M0R02_09985 [Bacteroidales bacterium]|nr:hypothetical protein [Bacteroidales bacterium]NLK82343.1 HEAT repeat domain-containing protein [Bacteroidales bacterium]
MDTNKSSIQLLCQKLQSNNNAQILEAIQKIRNHGDVSLIPFLLNVYVTNSDSIIQKSVAECLYDIKNPLAAPVFIEALANKDFINAQIVVLQAMWQSGIDYSKYADSFIHILIHSDFETAIEAFSVIDSCAETIDVALRNSLCETLIKASEKALSPHKDLLLQTVDLLQNV